MNSASDAFQCILPDVAAYITNVSASLYSMVMSRDLMEDYLHCQGFASSLLSANWTNQIYEFPYLIVTLCISLLLALLGLIWFIYEFVHEKSYRAENKIERYLRLGLSISLLLLLLPYSFCLWLAFVSYLSVESVHAGTKVALSENRRLSKFFENYIQSVETTPTKGSAQISKRIENLAKNLASQLEAIAPKVIEKGERCLIAKLSFKSLDIITLIGKMKEELQSLLADVMQLIDHSRLFYRNATSFLDLKQINFDVYSELIFKEFKVNQQKILMLLNIDRVLTKIQEVVEFASTMNNLRRDFTNNMENEFNMLQRFVDDAVAKRALEYATLNESLSAMLTQMRDETATEANFYLRPYMGHLELVYCVVALLILVLLCVFLGRFLRCATNRTFTRCVLMSIISTISTILIFLCIFVIVHFLHGAIYYNYRREINENEGFCNTATLPYCSQHAQTSVFLHSHLADNITTAIAKYRKQTLARLCENIREHSVNPQQVQWAQKLSEELTFFEEVFRSGAMFDVVKQELSLNNWYGLHDLLSAQSTTKPDAQARNVSQDMLACNLNTLKNYIFDQLFKHGIVVSLTKLAQHSVNLKSHLPGSNLTKLMKRVLRETHDLQDFCQNADDFAQKEIESIIELYSRELLGFESTFKQLPLCKDLRFASLGISRETYECIEYSLHGFHIGAFSILVHLCIIQIICICLAILYEKNATIGVVRSSSLNRMRYHDGSATTSAREVNERGASTKSRGSFLVKKPTHVRFKDKPTVSTGRRFKW
ncbi:uncharacterized protein LOC129246056 [Anastrepha obliqua]|uniref:uncharacterized protein LOC129246056 n=1 Tax=Anastrepha obliqua TaxID=95512 RepID=UPI002409C8AB|nr:uncharacterized protein LOC129246056 [Anastrepha obliqua]